MYIKYNFWNMQPINGTKKSSFNPKKIVPLVGYIFHNNLGIFKVFYKNDLLSKSWQEDNYLVLLKRVFFGKSKFQNFKKYQ